MSYFEISMGVPLAWTRLFPVVLSQIRYGAGSGTGPVEIGLAIVEVVEGADETPAMMAADFFDDEGLIVVYRVKNHSEFLHPPLASAHQK